MIERIDQQVNVRQATATTATTAAQQITEEEVQAPAASGITLQHPTDRVEISEQGYASVAATSTDTDTAKAVTAEMAEVATATATEATESSTTNLTSLSEDQLEELVTDGSISRAQADSELARRQGGAEEEAQ